MILRQLKVSDIDYIKKHSISMGIFDKLPEDTAWSYTLEHNDKILGIGGIEMITHTTAWAWMDWSDNSEEHVKTCYRVVREWMDELVVLYNITRLMAYVVTGFERGERTVQHLGFRLEHKMPRFVGEQSAGLWVKFYKKET